MQIAATGGILLSSLGWRAFWQSDATLPGVSLPSSVVTSTIETAVFRPQSLDFFLMLRVVNLATRSSIPTRSTVPKSSTLECLDTTVIYDLSQAEVLRNTGRGALYSCRLDVHRDAERRFEEVGFSRRSPQFEPQVISVRGRSGLDPELRPREFDRDVLDGAGVAAIEAVGDAKDRCESFNSSPKLTIECRVAAM